MTSQDTTFDRVADRYDETRGGMSRARSQAEYLLPLLGPADPLLEVGVGTGLVAAALAERGRSVVGLDLAPRMLERAHSRLPGRVLLADAAQLPVTSASVPAGYLIHVLHLVTDPARVLAETARVLRPGGRLVASSAMLLDPITDVDEILAQLEHDLERPPRRDPVAAIVEHAAEAGLSPVEQVPVPGIGHSPAEVGKLIGQRSWSWTWPYDDHTWAEAAERTLERLRALPDQDVVRDSGRTHTLLGFERPGG